MEQEVDYLRSGQLISEKNWRGLRVPLKALMTSQRIAIFR